MPKKRIYLDWNATTPLHPDVIKAMQEAMMLVGNPSSIHQEGRAARNAIEKARVLVARLVGGEAENVVFTSGATEAANALLASSFIGCCGRELACERKKRLLSAVEHPAFLRAAGGGGRTQRLKPFFCPYIRTKPHKRGWSMLIF